MNTTTEIQAPRADSGATLSLGHEFYLLRIYLRGDGFWLSVCEIVNHDTGRTWALLQGGYNKEDGMEIVVSA